MQRQLNDRITVSGQITPKNLAEIKAAGFDVVVDGRPDSEIGDDLASGVMAEAAERSGLRFEYIPIIPGTLPDDASQTRFSEAARAGKVFAYCGGGPRVILLASMTAVREGRDIDEVIAEARNAGIDLSPLKPELRRVAPSSE